VSTSDTFNFYKERLRKEAGHGTIVVVRIVVPVRVELQLVVVEVEDRGVGEALIIVRILVFVHPCHRNSKLVFVGNKTISHS
jgi:hypothetical protein